jgi:hypothetical protein
MTRKPISYAAEVVIDFPEKTFIGSFSRSGAYEVDADAEAVTLRLMRTPGAPGARSSCGWSTISWPRCWPTWRKP